MLDGSTIFAEGIRTKNKTLTMVTMYKLASTSNANTLKHNPTLYAQDDTNTIKIIDVNKELVNQSCITSRKREVVLAKITPKNYIYNF